jgi:hypothetical protein
MRRPILAALAVVALSAAVVATISAVSAQQVRRKAGAGAVAREVPVPRPPSFHVGIAEDEGRSAEGEVRVTPTIVVDQAAHWTHSMGSDELVVVVDVFAPADEGEPFVVGKTPLLETITSGPIRPERGHTEVPVELARPILPCDRPYYVRIQVRSTVDVRTQHRDGSRTSAPEVFAQALYAFRVD